MAVGYPGQGATVVQAIAAPANAASAQAQMQHQAQVLAAHAHAAAVAAGATAILQAPQATLQHHPVYDPQGMVASATSMPEGGQLTLSFLVGAPYPEPLLYCLRFSPGQLLSISA
jgi:hypothetical protein